MPETEVIGFHPEYLKTIPGILKIVEIVLGIIVLICASATWWFSHHYGGGWVQFVSVSAFVSTLILLIFYLINLRPRMPDWFSIVVFGIVLLSTASIKWWFTHFFGGSYVQFIGCSGFLTALVAFNVHILGLTPFCCDLFPVFVFGILVLICASWVWWFSHFHGGGLVQFVATAAFSSTIMWLALYFLNLRGKMPRWYANVILSIITFICACVWYWGSGQDWVQFVSIMAFMSTLVYLILHLLNLISRFPGPWVLIEFIYYCVFTVFYLVAAIVCAVKATYHSSIAAATFFAFAATAVYAVDTFFQFRAWKTVRADMTGQTQTTKTTTTITTTETQQY